MAFKSELRLISNTIWTFTTSYENNEYIKVKAEALSNKHTKAISDYCEQANFFQSSKYTCYLEGLTIFRKSEKKDQVVQEYQNKIQKG